MWEYYKQGAANCLIATPTALPQESRFSWVHRLCAAHQYSLPGLSRLMGLHYTVHDWDSTASAWAWAKLVNLAGAHHQNCMEAGYCFENLLRLSDSEKVLLYEKREPVCRWCQSCFACDKVPYLRWEWRLAGVTHCALHSQKLKERCDWCKSPLRLNLSLLVQAGRYSGAPDLANCSICGMSLFDTNTHDYHNNSLMGGLDTDQTLLQELISSIKSSFHNNDRQMVLDFSLYSEAILKSNKIQPLTAKAADYQVESSSVSNVDPSESYANEFAQYFFTPRLPILSNPSLRISGATFYPVSQIQNPHIPMPIRNKRSDSLRAHDRAKLVKALKVVRAEKRANGFRAALLAKTSTR
jgi:hypothetical protein